MVLDQLERKLMSSLMDHLRLAAGKKSEREKSTSANPGVRAVWPTEHVVVVHREIRLWSDGDAKIGLLQPTNRGRHGWREGVVHHQISGVDGLRSHVIRTNLSITQVVGIFFKKVGV